MTKREKFIAIIKSSLSGWLSSHIIRGIAPKIADALIAEGAIMPPCKVGDMAYIKKEQVLYHIEKLYDVLPLPDSCRHIIASLKAYIKGAPTEDVVEVCRCKECANGYHKTDTTVMCKIWNRLMITEDYCSYGAKMDGKEGE